MRNLSIPGHTRIQSPCRNTCSINESLTACDSCKRTVEEISNWAAYTHEQRREIMKELRTR